MGDGRKGKQREMRQAGGENVFDSENVAGKIACKQAGWIGRIGVYRM